MEFRRFAISTCALLLAGCATSKEAKDLAIDTAAAVQTLDAAISANAAASKKSAASADARIENLFTRTAAGQADLKLRMDLDPAAEADYERLRRFAEKQEAERQKALAAAAVQIKALTDAREQAKSPSVHLKAVSDNLTALGKEESAWTRLNSSVQFVRDVAKRVKDNGEAAQKAAGTASAEAKKESEKSEKAKFKE